MLSDDVAGLLVSEAFKEMAIDSKVRGIFAVYSDENGYIIVQEVVIPKEIGHGIQELSD